MAASRQLAERSVKTFGLPMSIDPIAAILDELYRTYGLVLWYENKIRNDFHRDDDLWDITDAVVIQMSGQIVAETAEEMIWLRLYRREREHYLKVAKEAAKLGIAQQQLEMTERMALTLALAIKEIIDRLELTTEQRERAPVIAREVLGRVKAITTPLEITSVSEGDIVDAEIVEDDPEDEIFEPDEEEVEWD